MNHKIKFSKIFFLLIFLFLASCGKDDDFSEDLDDQPQLEKPYQHGFFVLNEGQFPNEGTVTFISDDYQNVVQNIFQKENNGLELGNTPQSMFFDEERVYIITNSSNFIRMADRYTFKDLGIISGEMNNPRYGVIANQKAYITNGYGNKLTVIDLENHEVEKTIQLNNSSEYIFKAENGLIYIQQAAFGSGNKIAVLNPDSDQIIETIETSDNLNSIVLDGNFLYALTADKLQKFSLDSHLLTEEIDLTYSQSPSNLRLEDEKIYFTVEKKVYQMDISANSAPQHPLFIYDENSSHGLFYGFEVKDSKLYIADGGDFVSDSSIEIRDLEGNLLKSFPVGVGPNGFYFNN